MLSMFSAPFCDWSKVLFIAAVIPSGPENYNNVISLCKIGKNIFHLPLLATWALGTGVMLNPGALGGAMVPFPCDLESFRSGLGWECPGPCGWECPGPWEWECPGPCE